MRRQKTERELGYQQALLEARARIKSLQDDLRKRRGASVSKAIQYTSWRARELGYQRGIREFLKELREWSADLCVNASRKRRGGRSGAG
jgi:hypothetical protein